MKRLLILVFILIASTGYSQIASSAIHGVTGAGTLVPVAVEDDGRVKTNKLSAFTNGSTDAQGMVDDDGAVKVAIDKDVTRKAVKTTSNHTATSSPQQVTLIDNVRDVSFVLSETGKTMWVKTGALDAGPDSGVLVTSSILIENCASDTIISYYASPTAKFSLTQE